MLTRPRLPSSALNAAHLHQPPDRALWLGDLRLECFDEVMRLPERALCEALAEHGRELPGRELLSDLLGVRYATPMVQRHLLLVARFLEHKKTAALEIVAREQIDEETLLGWRTPGGRLHRLPVAVMLYGLAPEHLLSVLLWDRWHSRRRVSWRIAGKVRRLPDLEPETWAEFAERALGELRGSTTFHEVRLRAVLQREETGELLFGLREPAWWETLDTESGGQVTGRVASWVLLALTQDGARLDVCDGEVGRGVALATSMLRAACGRDVRFVPAHDTLDEAHMGRFVAAACDPGDDRFPLLEITARQPGRHDLRTITLRSHGAARAELSVIEQRRLMPLAMDWRDVRSMKIGFEGRYRFTVEPDLEDGRPVLWYSDRDRDKDVARRFEDYVRRHMNVSLVPRPGPRARTGVGDERGPAKGSTAWWRALLSPVVDTLAPWTRAAWAELEREGLITVSRAAAMRCGTPYVDHHACGVEDLDCDGEIALGWASVNPADPLLQHADAEACCPSCERTWRPGLYRLPLVERARVRLDLDQLWLWIVRAVARLATVDGVSGEPGVLMARTAAGVHFVAFRPLLGPDSGFDPALGPGRRTAWIKLDGEEGVGVPVSEVLADATTLGVAWHGGGEIVEALPAPAPTPREVPRLVRPEEALSRLSLRGSTVYLGNVPVLAPQAKALRALLAVFVHLAQEDARHGREERKGHTTQRLLGEAALMELHLDEGDVRTQVKRMNDAARKATVKAGWKPVELVERVGSGYRLAVQIEAEGALDLPTLTA